MPARGHETLSSKASAATARSAPSRSATSSPGSTAKIAQSKIVGYGLQLREKQKVRRVYGVLERQFRITFEKAALQKGITGENLMQNLERRLDSVIYRMGFGTSRAQARQVVRHGHIDVNGRKCDIPSAMVKVGDVISVRESSKNNPTILAARDATAHAPAPNWIDVDREGFEGSCHRPARSARTWCRSS